MSIPSSPAIPPELSAVKPSKLGITSFAIGIVAILLFCGSFVISQMLPGNNSRTITRIINGAFCLTPIISLAGLGLGIAAVVRKKGKKLFGIIGLIINSLTVFLPLCWLLITFLFTPRGGVF